MLEQNFGMPRTMAISTVKVAAVEDRVSVLANDVRGDEDTEMAIRLEEADRGGVVVNVIVQALPNARQGILYLPDGLTPVEVGKLLRPEDAARLVFVPATNFTGILTIPFVVIDNRGVLSNSTDAVIRVLAIHDVPAVTEASVMVEDGRSRVQNLMDDTAKPDGDASVVLAAAIDTNGDGIPEALALGLKTPIMNKFGIHVGTISVNRDGCMHFEPSPNYNGSVPLLTYTVVDPSGTTDTGMLDFARVLPVNDVPVITNASVMLAEDMPRVQNLTDYAADPNRDALAIVAATSGSHGAGRPEPLALGGATAITDECGQAVGEITVKPDGGMVFQSAPKDGEPIPVLTFTTLVSVDETPLVKPQIRPDVADSIVYISDTGVPIRADILANNKDVDPSTIQLIGTATPGDVLFVPGEGVWSVDVSAGQLLFTPLVNFLGVPSAIQYTVASPADVRSDCATVSVELRQEMVSLILLNGEEGKYGQRDTTVSFAPKPLPPNSMPLWENEGFKPVGLSLDGELYLAALLKNQVVVEKKPFSFGLPEGAFKDGNPSQKLAYRATRIDGSPLPAWLKFNQKTLVFYGVPPKRALSVQVLVTVNGLVGKEASAAFKVSIHRHRLWSANKPVAIALSSCRKANP